MKPCKTKDRILIAYWKYILSWIICLRFMQTRWIWRSLRVRYLNLYLLNTWSHQKLNSWQNRAFLLKPQALKFQIWVPWANSWLSIRHFHTLVNKSGISSNSTTKWPKTTISKASANTWTWSLALLDWILPSHHSKRSSSTSCKINWLATFTSCVSW